MEKLDEIFKMVFEIDFKGHELSSVILKAYMEEKDPALLSVVDSYQFHSDYAKLKREMIDYARGKSGGVAQAPDIFPSM